MIPSLEECRQLMADYQMLANIKAHSIVVAKIAEFLTGSLAAAGVLISVELTISGALLHDIAKTSCLETKEDHAQKGKEICLRHGYDDVAAIVQEHVILQGGLAAHGLTATEVVYYADKRVNHHEIVTLDQRLAYIVERYGLGDHRRCRAIEKNFQICRTVEAEIFKKMPFQPSELAVMLAGASGQVAEFFGREPKAC